MVIATPNLIAVSYFTALWSLVQTGRLHGSPAPRLGTLATAAGHYKRCELRSHATRTATKQPFETQLVKSGVVPRGHALVPGAGSAYDAVTLAAAGWKVTALDISPTAVKAATAAAKATPEGKAALKSGALRIQCGDFFQFRSAQPFDIVFDYT